jgi:hypothetical protein
MRRAKKLVGADTQTGLVLPRWCQHLPSEVGGEHERLQLQGGIQQPEHAERDLDAALGGSGPPAKAL